MVRKSLCKACQEPPSWRFFGRSRKGNLLLEAIVAIGVFAIFLGGIGTALIVGERSTVIGGDRARAAFLASEQLEGLRRIQQANFTALTTPGTYGVVEKNNAWVLTGAAVVRDGFTARVTLTNATSAQVNAEARVSWNFGVARSGSIVLRSYLTNWRKVTTVGNWGSVSQVSSTLQSGSPGFQKVLVAGNYAYITSAADAGLYVYDISSLTAPTRVSSSFTLGASAYGITIAGDRLYVATNAPSGEVQVIDISTPASLTSADILDTYDVPGTMGARSVAIYGNTLFVGTADSASEHHFYALEVSEIGEMDLLSSMSTSGSVMGMSLSDGYAYIVSSNNAGELQVIDVIEPEYLQYAPGTGIDMTNTFDGISIVTSGTSAVVGRANGSAIEEITLYEIGYSPVPSPPPGPWTLELGGDANSLALIEGTKYLFVGGSASNTQLRVVDLFAMVRGGTTTLTTVNVGETVNGLTYDWSLDRVFAVTSGNRLIIYRPN